MKCFWKGIKFKINRDGRQSEMWLDTGESSGCDYV